MIHRADRGQLSGLVVDKQERGILRGDEMVGERVAHWGAGHERLLLVANAARPTLVAVMVSSGHLILVISAVPARCTAGDRSRAWSLA